jgi:uncharacterized SAM-binding protein YcdF (DUF218 family)
MVEGAAIGVALWCVGYAFRLLPGITADTPGLLVFAGIGALLGSIGLHKMLVRTLVCAAIATTVVVETSLSNALSARWVRRDAVAKHPIDAVVVTSASVNPNGTMSADALDHLLTGLGLVRGGTGAMLVTTTVEQKFPRAAVSSQSDQSRIIALFGGLEQWVQTPPSASTREEALKAAGLLLPRGARRIVVVAQPMHTRRACGAFEAVGFQVTCVPSLSRSAGGADPGPWPADRLNSFGDWVYEVLATGVYRAKRWLQ